MKRIELNTGTMERGYWDGEKFIYTLKSKIASFDYNFDEDEYPHQYERAKECATKTGSSADQLEIWDPLSNKEIILFDKEDVDRIIAVSEAREFLIYMLTKTGAYFVCINGIKLLGIPKAELPIVGEYKKFTKETLKDGYLSAIDQFENDYMVKSSIKLHILPLTQPA